MALLQLAATGMAPRRSAPDRVIQAILRQTAGRAATAGAAGLGIKSSVVNRGS